MLHLFGYMLYAIVVRFIAFYYALRMSVTDAPLWFVRLSLAPVYSVHLENSSTIVISLN